MPRGGRRSGTAGKAYPNRSDMRPGPIAVAPSQTYGDGVAQAAAQQAIPVPTASPTHPPASAPGQAPPPQMAPPDPGLLTQPTTRPNEPVTAGLPIGPGPGPASLATGHPDDQVLANLYRAYQTAPTEGLRALIEQTERNA